MLPIAPTPKYQLVLHKCCRQPHHQNTNECYIKFAHYPITKYQRVLLKCCALHHHHNTNRCYRNVAHMASHNTKHQRISHINFAYRVSTKHQRVLQQKKNNKTHTQKNKQTNKQKTKPRVLHKCCTPGQHQNTNRCYINVTHYPITKLSTNLT